MADLDKFIRLESKSDRPSLFKLRDFILDGKYKEALDFCYSLDTYVREGVPESVLLFIRENDETKKLFKVKFSLVGEDGKSFASAIGEYHLSEDEKKSPLFVSSIVNAGEAWRDKVAKLVIKEIKS